LLPEGPPEAGRARFAPLPAGRGQRGVRRDETGRGGKERAGYWVGSRALTPRRPSQLLDTADDQLQVVGLAPDLDRVLRELAAGFLREGADVGGSHQPAHLLADGRSAYQAEEGPVRLVGRRHVVEHHARFVLLQHVDYVAFAGAEQEDVVGADA